MTAQQPKPLVAVLDGAAIAAPLPDVPYLVAGLGLVAGGGAPHLCAGYGFSGKTLAWQSALVALAAGKPVWGGLTPAAPIRVAHVDLEQGDRLSRRRYQRIALAMGVDLAALGDRLVLAAMPRVSLAVKDVNAWRELMTGRDLVLVDSLRAASGGQDENDSAIGAGLDMLGRLSEETGCRALVIHHARKPSQNAPEGRYSIRGSSAIFDACDSVYVFTGEKSEPVRVEHVKARSHGEPVEDFALQIADVEIDGDAHAGLSVRMFGAEVIAHRREEKARAKAATQASKDVVRIMAELEVTDGQTTTELRDASCLDGKRFKLAMAHPLATARIEKREDRNGRSKVVRHFLTGKAA